MKSMRKLSDLKPGSFFSRILLANIIVIIITLVAVSLFFFNIVERYLFSLREFEITNDAHKVSEVLQMDFQTQSYSELANTAEALSLSMDIKVRIIDSRIEESFNDVVLAIPTDEQQAEHIGFEGNEVDNVLEGNTLLKKMYGPEVQRLLVAIPVYYVPIEPEEEDPDAPQEAGEDAETAVSSTADTLLNPDGEEIGEEEILDGQELPEEPFGVITVSANLSRIDTTLGMMTRLTLYSALFATAVASVIALILSKTISQPLKAMVYSAKEMAAGNYRKKVKGPMRGDMGELTQALNKAIEETEKMVNEQKRLQVLREDLINSVSHEFRVPLTSIQGFTESLLEGYVEEEEKEKCLRLILDNALHLNQLVKDLLQLAHIEQGTTGLSVKHLWPGTVAEKAYHSILHSAQEKELALSLEIEDGLPDIVADPGRLYQILINLLENAVSYTEPGGRIRLSVSRLFDNVVYTVTDNGIGISNEDLPFIFNQFYKADKSRNRSDKGKGLGLAIVHEWVKVMGGEVSVKSHLGEGSVFRVSFPVQPDNAMEDLPEDDEPARSDKQ